MCGICGIVSTSLEPSRLETAVAAMSCALDHRGPDDAGQETVCDRPSCVIAHRRLSIIDLSADAHQPMRVAHCWITFNGEIYNYRDIRHALEARGHRFVTASDT